MENLQTEVDDGPVPCPGTLGDVLYSGKGKRLVSEGDWVRIVRAVALGDERALHALYERTNRIVFTLAVRITRDREAAEEVTLDVFHDVWRRASTYDPDNGTVVGWIMNQARSRAIDRLRLEQRKKRVDPHPESPAFSDSAASAEELFELRQLAHVLRSALATLTPQERQAIQTAYFSGLSHAEVAMRLNEPLGTIKTRIRSGLGKLRKSLGKDENA